MINNNKDLMLKLEELEDRLKTLEQKESEDFVAIFTRIDDLETKLKRLELNIASINES